MTKEGVTVFIKKNTPKNTPMIPGYPPITIYYEDPHLLVLSKPAGLLTQSDHTQTPSLVDWLRIYFKRHYVGLIHRLDRNTSGLMIIAKRSKSARRLTEDLQHQRIKRTYSALLVGQLKPLKKSILWTDFLAKNTVTNTMHTVSKTHPDAKHAALQVTAQSWHILGQHHQIVTLCSFELSTGRSHQIRVQAFARGYPLVGDPKYYLNHPIPFGARLALHSHSIEFFHPSRDFPAENRMILHDELPQAFDLPRFSP